VFLKHDQLYENRQEAISKRQKEKISDLKNRQTNVPGFMLGGDF
jgi:hypothetical protein